MAWVLGCTCSAVWNSSEDITRDSWSVTIPDWTFLCLVVCRTTTPSFFFCYLLLRLLNDAFVSTGIRLFKFGSIDLLISAPCWSFVTFLCTWFWCFGNINKPSKAWMLSPVSWFALWLLLILYFSKTLKQTTTPGGQAVTLLIWGSAPVASTDSKLALTS